MLFSGQFDHLAFCFSVRSVTKEKIGTVHIALLLIVFGSHILAKEKGGSVWSLLLLFDWKFRINLIKGNTQPLTSGVHVLIAVCFAGTAFAIRAV